MSFRHFPKALLAGAGTLALTACGGGGGSAGTNFIPSAPVTPTPTPTASAAATVIVVNKPAVGDFASVGASTNLAQTASSRFGPISSADADQPHIRYTSGGVYEIQLPGTTWDTLIPYKGLANPTTDNVSFQPASAAQNRAGFSTVTARWAGYSYSDYAAWYSLETGRYGWVAVGVPTAATAIPVTGSATYNGNVHGSADIMQTDQLSAPNYYPSSVDGKITLNFDFQKGALAGGMDLFLAGAFDPIKIGSFSLTDTVYAAGSTTYSGRFDTAVAGQNFFLGRFTGPNAEETIGGWALPFTYDVDGQAHQAIGAWVAKSH